MYLLQIQTNNSKVNVKSYVMTFQISSKMNWDVSKTQMEVKFKPDAKPVFCKPRPVPFAIREDLSKGYDEGIAKRARNLYSSTTMAHQLFPTAKRYFLGNSSQRSGSAGITQQGSTMN